MKINITNAFKQATKKLHKNQKNTLIEEIEHIKKHPTIGELKKGDLAGIRVYKFQVINQLMLLSYSYEEDEKNLTLLSLGSHENFYKKLKQ